MRASFSSVIPKTPFGIRFGGSACACAAACSHCTLQDLEWRLYLQRCSEAASVLPPVKPVSPSPEQLQGLVFPGSKAYTQARQPKVPAAQLYREFLARKAQVRVGNATCML